MLILPCLGIFISRVLSDREASKLEFLLIVIVPCKLWANPEPRCESVSSNAFDWSEMVATLGASICPLNFGIVLFYGLPKEVGTCLLQGSFRFKYMKSLGCLAAIFTLWSTLYSFVRRIFPLLLATPPLFSF